MSELSVSRTLPFLAESDKEMDKVSLLSECLRAGLHVSYFGEGVHLSCKMLCPRKRTTK